MQQRIISLIWILAISMGLSAQSNRENEVMARVKMLNDAIFMNKDSVALDGLLADELTYGHSEGRVENRQQMISNAVKNRNTYTGFVMDSFTVFFEEKKIAIVRHVLRAVVNANGTQSNLHLGVLQVWIRDDRQWRLMARQSVKY